MIMIPKTFQIGGHTFEVNVDENLASEAKMGECNAGTNTVRLASWLMGTQLEETFIHEVIEAIDKIYELNLDHPHICTLSVGIHQALTTERSMNMPCKKKKKKGKK